MGVEEVECFLYVVVLGGAADEDGVVFLPDDDGDGVLCSGYLGAGEGFGDVFSVCPLVWVGLVEVVGEGGEDVHCWVCCWIFWASCGS